VLRVFSRKARQHLSTCNRNRRGAARRANKNTRLRSRLDSGYVFFCPCLFLVLSDTSIAAIMLCPNEIYIFGRPVHGTNTGMRKESMAVVEVASDTNVGGRKVVLTAQSAHDSILLVNAQLRRNSRLNTTVDILENAAVMQRRHVK
jgi:hypothetical protein